MFGATAFAPAAFSLPMIAECDADRVGACLSSVHAVRRNPAARPVWAALIVVPTAVGFATAVAGRAVILPWLAYASGHGGRETIDASGWKQLAWSR